jgi:hypothetical protein
VGLKPALSSDMRALIHPRWLYPARQRGYSILTITFKGSEHKNRFLHAIQDIGKFYQGKVDSEYGAALLVLTSGAGTWQKAQGYVSDHGIDFEELLANEDFSGAYTELIKFAGNLFNGRIDSSPVELMRLDSSNFNLAVSALLLRYHGMALADLVEE